MDPNSKLEDQHTRHAIRVRLSMGSKGSYLGDFVFGAVDGIVTTFAVVAGAAGAGLSGLVALALGLANLLGDGVSMALGNYLRSKSDLHLIEKATKMEEAHIDLVPEGEKEEIRQIFKKKGFDGALLESIVDVITQDRQRWIDTMLIEEHGLSLHPPIPIKAAAVILAAFCGVGALPLIPYLYPSALSPRQLFSLSSVITAIAFAVTGAVKGWVLKRSIVLSAVETFVIGALASVIAYATGTLFRV